MEAQNAENKAIVAEGSNGEALGLCCLTSDVDVNVLAQCFELLPYDNLLKPHFWAKAYAQMYKEKFGEDYDTSAFSRWLEPTSLGGNEIFLQIRFIVTPLCRTVIICLIN